MLEVMSRSRLISEDGRSKISLRRRLLVRRVEQNRLAHPVRTPNSFSLATSGVVQQVTQTDPARRNMMITHSFLKFPPPSQARKRKLERSMNPSVKPTMFPRWDIRPIQAFPSLSCSAGVTSRRRFRMEACCCRNARRRRRGISDRSGGGDRTKLKNGPKH